MDKQPDEREADRRTGRARVQHDRDDGRPATSAQFRDEMPSGRTIGRSSARDPSAAPMDTDDEAAGHPPSADAVEHERTALRAGDVRAAAPEETDDTRDAAARSQSWATLLVVLLLVLGCVALWLAMR